MEGKKIFNKVFWDLIIIVFFLAVIIVVSVLSASISYCFFHPAPAIINSNYPVNYTKYANNATYANQTIDAVCANGKTEDKANLFVIGAYALSSVVILIEVMSMALKISKGAK